MVFTEKRDEQVRLEEKTGLESGKVASAKV